jgi:hypothetical protein
MLNEEEFIQAILDENPLFEVSKRISLFPTSVILIGQAADVICNFHPGRYTFTQVPGRRAHRNCRFADFAQAQVSVFSDRRLRKWSERKGLVQEKRIAHPDNKKERQ